MIKSFLNDIKNNSKVMNLIGNPTHIIDECIQKTDEYIENQKTKEYSILRPVDGDYGSFTIENGELKWKSFVGTVISRRSSGLIDRPVKIRTFDGKLWVCSYGSGRVSIFNEHFSFEGYFGEHGNFDTNDRFTVPYGIDILDNKVALAFYNRHRCGVYNKTTGKNIWLFGDGTIGNPENGKLNYPVDVAWLPNGNLLVSCLYGQPTGAVSNAGYIAEFDGETGSFVKVHLSHDTPEGYPWNNSVDNPMTIRMVQNPTTNNWELWVAYNDQHIVAVFDYNETNNEFEFNRIYSKNSQMNAGNLNARDIYVDYTKGSVYFTILGMNVVAEIDLDTHNLKGYIGFTLWEDFDGNPETSGAFVAPYSLTILGDKICVADYTNNRIQAFPLELISETRKNIPYTGDDLTKYKKIDYVSDDRFVIDNSVLTAMPQEFLKKPLLKEISVCGIL